MTSRWEVADQEDPFACMLSPQGGGGGQAGVSMRPGTVSGTQWALKKGLLSGG